jgi:hypothetical protein
MKLKSALKYTSPVGYAAVKASERKNDPERQARKDQEAENKSFQEQWQPERIAQAASERGAEVAKFKIKVPVGKDGGLPGGTMVLYEHGEVAITHGKLVKASKRYQKAGSIIGAEASIDQTSKSKATWTVGTGLLGGKKIAGHVFLTITGPDISVTQECHEICSRDARKFAVEVNRLAAQLTPATADPAPVTSTSDELAKLASLREAGALTEDEFSAAKARLLV